MESFEREIQFLNEFKILQMQMDCVDIYQTNQKVKFSKIQIKFKSKKIFFFFDRKSNK